MARFGSDGWPASRRNGGRLQIGIGGPLRRNTHIAHLSVGASYAEGNFGAARNTSILSAPLSVRVKLGDVRLSAAVPYMRIRSDGIIFTGIDSTAVVVAPGATPRQRTAKGALAT